MEMMNRGTIVIFLGVSKGLLRLTCKFGDMLLRVVVRMQHRIVIHSEKSTMAIW